jgi:uncharacterized membrane protein YgaE (UPF0421/DUF939 family)
VGIVLIITLYNAFQIRYTPSIACLIVVTLCTNEGMQPISYALGRIWDTAIGLAVGMLINTLVFPYDNSRRIKETVESLDRDVITFLEEIFDGDSILPDPKIMIRKIDELERQLKIFSKQRFLLNSKRQSRKLQQFLLCDANARQLVAHMEVLCHLEKPGILNDENRQLLMECGANIRDTRKLELFQESDIVANYHVSQILSLRQALLDSLIK